MPGEYVINLLFTVLKFSVKVNTPAPLKVRSLVFAFVMVRFRNEDGFIVLSANLLLAKILLDIAAPAIRLIVKFCCCNASAVRLDVISLVSDIQVNYSEIPQ